ncbi:MAG: diguanylate cyclase [Desulfobacterales bacterium]|nr:diguanylate cyclase [Desulfobacterales bacterium]
MEKDSILFVNATGPDALFDVKSFFEKEGFNVLAAASDQEALDLAREHDFALALLHIRTTGNGGADVASSLRLNAKTKGMPILFLSDAVSEEEIPEFAELGPVDFVFKPFPPRVVQHKVRMLLAFQRSEKERMKSNEELENVKQEAEELHEQLEQAIERTHELIFEPTVSSLVLDHIFNTSTDGIWIIDENFKVIRINDTLLDLFETTSEEAAGKHCYELFSDALCHGDDCPMRHLLEGGDGVEMDLTRKLKSGAVKHLILSAAPFRGFADEIIGAVVSLKDITQRKEAEEELKRLNKKLHMLSTMDALTKLANRRRFDEYLKKEWIRLYRERKPMGLIMCDIDFFKFFNDTYGHQAGDDCLSSVARAIDLNVKRPADLACRYGGEEFTIILPDTSLQGAAHLAESIRKEVEALQVKHAGSKVNDYVTLSLGVSSMVPADRLACEVVVEDADKALYEAKERGRNQVFFFEK